MRKGIHIHTQATGFGKAGVCVFVCLAFIRPPTLPPARCARRNKRTPNLCGCMAVGSVRNLSFASHICTGCGTRACKPEGLSLAIYLATSEEQDMQHSRLYVCVYPPPNIYATMSRGAARSRDLFCPSSQEGGGKGSNYRPNVPPIAYTTAVAPLSKKLEYDRQK